MSNYATHEQAEGPEDAGRNVKARLRADPRAAMKGRHAFEAKVIRALVAAIDKAEAPSIHAGQTAPVHHHFHSGSAEVERLLLSRSDVRRVLSAEIHERERSAAELEHLDMMDRAEALRAEALPGKALHIHRCRVTRFASRQRTEI